MHAPRTARCGRDHCSAIALPVHVITVIHSRLKRRSRATHILASISLVLDALNDSGSAPRAQLRDSSDQASAAAFRMICRQPDLVRRNRDAAMNDETGWRERPGSLSSIDTDKPRWIVDLYLQTLGRCSPILTKGDSSPSMTTERSAVGPTSPKKSCGVGMARGLSINPTRRQDQHE